MSDFRISDQDVSTLIQGFCNIKDSLSLKETDKDISRASVGHDGIITALNSFNDQVDRTKNKYRKKTESFIDFLKEAKSGSDDLDKQLQDAIKVNEESAKGTGAF